MFLWSGKKENKMNIYEVIKLDVFSNTKILAGNKGLSNKVLNATFVDAPDGYQWLKSEDFILTTGYAFTNDRYWEEGIMRLLEIIVEKNCSGLGIKLGRYIPKLPNQVINFANDKNIPIISLPNNLPWSNIIVPVVSEINKQHQNELERIHDVYEQFHYYLKKNGDLQELGELLHKVLGKPVTIYVRRDNEKIDTSKNKFSKEDIESIISTFFCNREQTIEKIKWNNKVFTIRWIIDSDNLEGLILLWGVDSKLYTWQKAALEQTSAITAREIERLKTISIKFQRFRNDFLLKLLNDSENTREVLLRRAKEVNWNLEDEYNVVLLDCHLDKSVDGPVWQKKISLLEKMQNELKILLPKTPVGFDEKNYFTLLISKEISLDILKNRLEKLIVKLDVGSFYGGVGRLSAIDKLSVSYNEALVGLNVAYTAASKSSDAEKRKLLYIRCFSQLNIERILFANNPTHEAKNLAKESLQEIMEYDRLKNGELLKTLRIFLNHKANYDETANILFVHKNTVRYRINTIRDLSGLDPVDIKDQLLFQLALTTLESFPALVDRTSYDE